MLLYMFTLEPILSEVLCEKTKEGEHFAAGISKNSIKQRNKINKPVKYVEWGDLNLRTNFFLTC